MHGQLVQLFVNIRHLFEEECVQVGMVYLLNIVEAQIRFLSSCKEPRISLPVQQVDQKPLEPRLIQLHRQLRILLHLLNVLLHRIE